MVQALTTVSKLRGLLAYVFKIAKNKTSDSTVKYSKSTCLMFAQTVIRKSLRVGKNQADTDRNKSRPKTKNNPVLLSVKLSLLCSQHFITKGLCCT